MVQSTSPRGIVADLVVGQLAGISTENGVYGRVTNHPEPLDAGIVVEKHSVGRPTSDDSVGHHDISHVGRSGDNSNALTRDSGTRDRKTIQVNAYVRSLDFDPVGI